MVTRISSWERYILQPYILLKQYCESPYRCFYIDVRYPRLIPASWTIYRLTGCAWTIYTSWLFLNPPTHTIF